MTKKLKNMKFSLSAMTAMVLAATTIAAAAPLYRDLYVGTSGLDVGSLQTFLAADPTIYPQGRVTNYFGFLTKSAVSNFQVRNGISAIGRVGPQTRASINAQMVNGNPNIDNISPTVTNLNINVNSNSATLSWNTSEGARAKVYYSNLPLNVYETETDVVVSNGQMVAPDSTYRTVQNISINNLQANTTYYYMIYVTDQGGNVTVSAPSATFRTNN